MVRGGVPATQAVAHATPCLAASVPVENLFWFVRVCVERGVCVCVSDDERWWCEEMGGGCREAVGMMSGAAFVVLASCACWPAWL